MVSPLEQDMAKAAKEAVQENLRHSEETLFMLLAKWFPEATDGQIEAAVKEAL